MESIAFRDIDRILVRCEMAVSLVGYLFWHITVGRAVCLGKVACKAAKGSSAYLCSYSDFYRMGLVFQPRFGVSAGLHWRHVRSRSEWNCGYATGYC